MKNSPTWKPSIKPWWTWTETAIDLFLSSAIVIFPIEIFGQLSGKAKLLACESDVKSTQGIAEKWIRLSTSKLLVKSLTYFWLFRFLPKLCLEISQNLHKTESEKTQKCCHHASMLLKHRFCQKYKFRHCQFYSENFPQHLQPKAFYEDNIKKWNSVFLWSFIGFRAIDIGYNSEKWLFEFTKNSKCSFRGQVFKSNFVFILLFATDCRIQKIFKKFI